MSRKLIMILLPILIFAGIGIWLLQPEKQEEPQIPEVVKIEELPREVLLYFADPEGRYLVSEMQQITGCEEDSDCVKNLVSVLLAGPQGDLLPILPAHAKVLSVELKDDLALIDFDGAFVHAHPGGSLSELLTVYGLANSLSVNFPYLKQLQILVEGEQVATLKGHVGLSRPIKADFSYSHPPQTGEEKEQDNE